MEKIPSFLKDHDLITPGFYVSTEDKDLTTYDLRFFYPNSGRFMSYAAIHSIEHIVATVLRNNRLKEDVVYFGPMGCRTGFYLIMRDTPPAKALQYFIECAQTALELNEVPGSDKKSCGNYLEHNLSAAKKHLFAYLKGLKKH